uniref:Uncharacterized protein n=1 Tax=Strigamia maritima TaxID=126957 RepID=T1J840_STRMM
MFTCLTFLGIFLLRVNGRIAKECDKYDQRVEECWVKHDVVPNCRGIDPLVACNENNVAQLPWDCSMRTKTRAQHVLGVSQLLHRNVCARRSDILEEFISRPQCWEMARLCLAKLPISFEEVVYRFDPPLYDLDTDVVPLAARKKIVAAECYEEGEAIQICYSRAIGCDYLEEFINLILDNSVCSPYRIEDCPTLTELLTSKEEASRGELMDT